MGKFIGISAIVLTVAFIVFVTYFGGSDAPSTHPPAQPLADFQQYLNPPSDLSQASTPNSASSSDPGENAYDQKNYELALNIWLPRAKNGDANAQYLVGWLYKRGEGVPQNFPEAVQWFQKSAEQGFAQGERELGVMYENGSGLAQNYVAAKSWFTRAARQGDAYAQFHLGAMFATGEGITPDLLTAYIWENIAASSGSPPIPDATNLRDKLAASLSNDDVARGQELALICQQSHFRRCGPFISASDVGVGDVSVPMQESGGTYVVPVMLNGVLSLGFIVDSGASDVYIPDDVAHTLFRAGTIEKDDMVGTQEYSLADGTTAKNVTFKIRSLKVGDITLQNVIASIGTENSTPLLGQSFLSRFSSWSIDNNQHILHLKLVDTPEPANRSSVASPAVSTSASANVPTALPAGRSAETTPSTGYAAAPSFDCSKVTVIAEETICGDPSLATLDSSFATKWTEVGSVLKRKPTLVQYLEARDHVRAFLDRRNRCNDSKTCISQAYSDISEYLSSVVDE